MGCAESGEAKAKHPTPANMNNNGHHKSKKDSYQSNSIWKGFYLQNGNKVPIIFRHFKAIKNGAVSGCGYDSLGKFEVTGSADVNGNAAFVQKYEKYAVNYKGQIKGKEIHGTWDSNGMTGQFELKRMQKEWSGIYTQGGAQKEMRIDHFNMSKGMIKGSGEDAVGQFTITGTYGKQKDVNFVKAYIGKHTVQYQGFRHKKDIVGMWAVGG